MTEEAVRVSPRSPGGAGSPGAGPVSRRPGGAGLPVTTELVVFALVALAVLIAAAVADDFGAGAAWTLVTVLGAAYILSRGLAKYERPAEDHLD